MVVDEAQYVFSVPLAYYVYLLRHQTVWFRWCLFLDEVQVVVFRREGTGRRKGRDQYGFGWLRRSVCTFGCFRAYQVRYRVFVVIWRGVDEGVVLWRGIIPGVIGMGGVSVGEEGSERFGGRFGGVETEGC